MLLSLRQLALPGLLVGLLVAVAARAEDHPSHDPHAAKPHGANDAHPQGDASHGAHKPTAIEHVWDSDDFHLFTTFSPHNIELPKILGFQITKFMVLEVLASLLVLLFYVPLARRIAAGEPASGVWWNALEVLLVFVRDQIAKPSLGEDKADRYVPFLWTLFLFILFNNLLGMFPFLGSATAHVAVTLALALIVFFAIHGSAVMAMASAPAHGHGHDGHGHGHEHDAHPAGGATVFHGLGRYLASLWPQIDVPIPIIGFLIKLMVCVIEVGGILVRNGVLAIRLFANMFAGHMVLATILLFISMAADACLHPALWGTITASSVFGILALSLLELFVAFLQAYIFTFLTALFMGMAINPQH